MQLLVLFTLISGLISLNIQAKETCGPGVIQYLDEGKEIVERKRFCLEDSELNKFIYSESCKGRACKPLTDFALETIELGGRHDIGSPLFKLCREIGGSPQIITFSFDKVEDYKGSRCLFKDGTFVSNGLLMHVYRDNVSY